jgi:hypothetical protein
VAVEDAMKKIYFLKPFYRIACSFYVAIAVIYGFLKLQGVFFDRLGWEWNVIILSYTIIGIASLFNIFFAKLTVSESGIEYQVFLQHFFLPWNQVEEIPARFSFKILIGKSSGRKRKRSIPLYLFANNPIDSDLGGQIKQYAPHLFEQENKKSVQSV